MTPEQLAESAETVGVQRKHGRWSRTDMLLAAIADRVAVGNWQFLLANSGKGKKPKAPDPIPRPGVDAKASATRPLTAAARTYLDDMRERHRLLTEQAAASGQPELPIDEP